MTPSRKASSTAAAGGPGRLPRPPMITAMKQNGRMSTPPRKSTGVIGGATTPPHAARPPPRQPKPDRKGKNVAPAGRDAHRDRGVAVVPHRAHPGAEPGVVQEQ